MIPSFPSTPKQATVYGTPLTPTTSPSKQFYHAPPATPRTTSANAILSLYKAHLRTSLTISSFSKLLSTLQSRPRDREETIDEFRTDFLCGALMYDSPPIWDPEAQDTFSDGTRLSLSSLSTASAFSADTSLRPLNAMEAGLLAEANIKATLKPFLLKHRPGSSLPRLVRQKVMPLVLAHKRDYYVSLTLMDAPSFSEEYEQYGYHRPGLRWGKFKPDLIRFSPGKESGTVVFEIIECKFTENQIDTIFSNWKVQAVFCILDHLALTKLLSLIPSLVPSHRCCMWISRDPYSSRYVEKPIAIRTSQAFVEGHLFRILPEWLQVTTRSQWDTYLSHREKVERAKIERDKQLAREKKEMADREALDWHIRLPSLPDADDLDLFPPLPDDDGTGEDLDLLPALPDSDSEGEWDEDPLETAFERLVL